MFKITQRICVVLFTTISCSLVMAQNTELPSIQDLYELIQAQQAQLQAQQQRIDQLTELLTDNQTQLHETSERAEQVELIASATADQVEVLSEQTGDDTFHWYDNVRVGGYGEVLYNNGTSSTTTDELDVQRFIFYINNEFTDRLRFISEIEIEHTFIADDDRSPGAIELEQAFIEWDYLTRHSLQAGLFLVPVGILNEVHEPDTFFGVERNQVESRIIPTTYRVNGLQFLGRFGNGWSYNLGIHEGLFFESGSSGELRIRDSRQNGARVEVDSPAFTGRLRYSGLPGLELAAALHYQTDFTQDATTRGNIGREGVFDEFGSPVTDLSGLLAEAHAIYRNGPFEFRGLYARWFIDDDIERVFDNGVNTGIGRDEQYGFYLEPSWRFTNQWGVFGRYEQFDERAGSNLGLAADSERRRFLFGVNYWLHPNVVFKADYQVEFDEGDSNLDGFNLGVGWSF